MPITSDATALVALGKINQISILQTLNTNIYISPWVRGSELRSVSQQIDLGIAKGWLHEETPSKTNVDMCMRLTGLDQGEAESIVLAGELNLPEMQLLLDEGRASKWIQSHKRRPPRFHLICLGQVLHQIEDAGGIASAELLMQEMLDKDTYRWASSVRHHYQTWCVQQGIKPLPDNPKA